MTNFTDLGLDTRILKALETEGYVTPTPIQAQAIPAVMKGADLLGIAQTGTGKTAAFALPILHRLAADKRPAPRRGCRVLVLSPTRELASQIAESFRTYGRNIGITVAVIFGGVGYRPQIQSVSRGVDILVATPGRLLDHVDQRHVDLSGTEIFVLDEADQMLDLGFLQPIRRVVAQFTAPRQNLFFSATMPGEIGKLAGELLRNPTRVSVAPAATTAERVSQRVIHVERHKKRAVLVELLENADLKRTLVFTRTKRGADKVAEHLEAADIRVAAIHGNKSQGQRERALAQFRRSEIRVLVATDIAARGIDIDQVSHVINFELPEVPEAYVHRIGRTARAGEAGIAISLCDPDERSQLREIERLTRQALPHENRITGDEVPLDATGAPRSRPAERSKGHRGSGSGRPQGDRNRSHARGDRDSRPRGDREARGDRDSRSRATRDAGGFNRGPRRPHGEGDTHRSAPTIAASDNAEFGTTYHPMANDRPMSDDRGNDRKANGQRGDRSFAPRGDRKPRGDGFKPRGDDRNGGNERGERSFAPRADRKPSGDGFKPRGDNRNGGNDRGERSFAPRGDRKPRGDGFKPRGEDRNGGNDRGERSFAPRGDRKPNGDGFTPRGDDRNSGNDRGERSFAPRGDRKPNGDGFKSRGDDRNGGNDRGERSFAPRGERKPNGDGFKPRGDNRNGGNDRGDRSFAPRGERKPSGDGFKPRNDSRNGGGDRKPNGFAPRGEGAAPRADRGASNGGKPGGFQGLKRKPGGKPAWSNRPE